MIQKAEESLHVMKTELTEYTNQLGVNVNVQVNKSRIQKNEYNVLMFQTWFAMGEDEVFHRPCFTAQQVVDVFEEKGKAKNARIGKKFATTTLKKIYKHKEINHPKNYKSIQLQNRHKMTVFFNDQNLMNVSVEQLLEELYK